MIWECVLPGVPGVKGNSKRILRVRGRTIVASSAKDKAKENAAAYHIRRARPAVMFDGPVHVDVWFHFAIPKSKEGKVNIGDPRWQRPDMENMIKMLHDAMNGVVWNDDAQVASLFANKVWADLNETVVKVRSVVDGV